MNEAETNSLSKNFNTLSLIQFAFPSMMMMLFIGLYTIIDTIFVSRFVNTDALSAINIVCPIINIIVGLGTMLATGGSALIAKEMGNGKMNEARRHFTLIIITGVVISCMITLIGFLFLDKLIWRLGASELLYPYCKDYLTIQLIFVIGNIMQVLYQNLFVTAGKPTLGLILSVSAGVANGIFDYIFIVVLDMGIKGAALATSIGYMIPTMIGTLFFLLNKDGLYFCKPKFNCSVIIKSCCNGASEMVSQLSTAITTFLFNAIMMKLLGENGVAAITIMIYSQFLLTTFYIGFSMGVAPIISYHYGSQNRYQLRKIVRICFCFIITLSILIFLFSFFAGETIIKLFVRHNAIVYQIIQQGFQIFSFSFLFSGLNIFASALYTALSNGKVSAILSFSRTFGFIIMFLMILPRFLNVIGVWLAIPIAECLTLILTIGFMKHFNEVEINKAVNEN